MTIEERKRIISNDYTSIMVEYNRFDAFMKRFEGYPVNIINEKYGIVYYPVSQIPVQLTSENWYAVTPKIFGLLETTSLDAMGVNRVQDNPFLALKGEGVLLGFVDTGIDYTHSAFKNEDNTTRIVSIWDQTVENLEADESIFYYGVEYSKEQINNALQNEDPFSVLPSRDEIGHGTMIAGAAGGSADPDNNFQGVVPEAEFVIVKLRQARQNLRNFFFVPESVDCYQQDDIMFGIQYLINKSYELKKPIVICIALGTNQGPHDGSGILSSYIKSAGSYIGRGIVIAAGNEGNSKKHFFGSFDRQTGSQLVELNVAENERGFSMELRGFAPATYSIDMTSPSGEYIPQILPRLSESREIRFLFENTIVYIDYLVIESQSGNPFVLIRLLNPAPGIWKFRVYGRGATTIRFHVWLPMSGFVSDNTYFISSDPNTTITNPGNTSDIPTVTAYNAATNTIYTNASRGYTSDDEVKPDMAAPGVDVLVPFLGNTYQAASGTSIAAANVTGLAAMLMEWGIVRENYYFISSLQIERFLIRGVEKDPGTSYPNNIWGYGKSNIYNTFISISSTIQ